MLLAQVLLEVAPQVRDQQDDGLQAAVHEACRREGQGRGKGGRRRGREGQERQKSGREGRGKGGRRRGREGQGRERGGEGRGKGGKGEGRGIEDGNGEWAEKDMMGEVYKSKGLPNAN